MKGNSFAFLRVREKIMKQSIFTEENKKYKKISLQTKPNITSTQSELRIVSSLKRISTKPNEINKIFYDTSKATSKELYEQVDLATEEIINLFYDMELAILAEGYVPLIMGERFHTLQAIISLCKIQLCLPGLNEISFPKSFIEEYLQLLERTDKAICVIKTRIDKLKIIKEADSLKNVLEKNLFTLNMLRMHYISALGLPEMA